MYQWMLDQWDKKIDYSLNDGAEIDAVYVMSIYFALCYFVDHGEKSELERLGNCIKNTEANENKYWYKGYNIFRFSRTSYEGSGKFGIELPNYTKIIECCEKKDGSEASLFIEEMQKEVRNHNRKIDDKKIKDFETEFGPDQIKIPDNGYGKYALEFLWKNTKTERNLWQKQDSVDDDILALYIAVSDFLNTGSKEDAFDVYSAYVGEFLAGDKLQELINFISSYENNASRLVNKHRDHYSHSVYVFILGLAIYQKSNHFRTAFEEYYNINMEKTRNRFKTSIDDKTETAEKRFLRLWGLTALFHDIGYQLEIPFNQIKENTSFTYNGNEKRHLYYQYINVDRFTELEPFFEECEKEKYWDTKHLKWFDKENGYLEYRQKLVENTLTVPECIEDVFAYHICRALRDRSLDPSVVSDKLKEKAKPEEFLDNDEDEEIKEYECYMDHAYFSAILLFKQMIRMFALDEFVDNLSEKLNKNDEDLYNEIYTYDGKKLSEKERKELIVSLHRVHLNEWMDAMTAIVMHNKFFEIVLKKKSKEKNGISLGMHEHPLAYLLMLCDELQCWDRTSFGKKSIKEMHPIDFQFDFDDKESLIGKYIFDDKSEEGAVFEKDEKTATKAGTIRKFFHFNLKVEKKDENGKTKIDNNGKTKYETISIPISFSQVNCNDPKKPYISSKICKAYKSDDGKIKDKDCKFVADINNIVSVDNEKELILQVEMYFGKAGTKIRNTLSEISMRYLYEMSEKLYSRYMKEINSTAYEEFQDISTEEKLKYVTFVKRFGEGLNNIDCFYSNQKMMYDLKEEFGEDDIEKILNTEIDHLDRYCDSHIIERIDKEKVRNMVRLFIKILKDEDAVTVYELPKKEH